MASLSAVQAGTSRASSLRCPPSHQTSLRTSGASLSLRFPQSRSRRLRISCEAAKPETLEKVISVVTKQLAVGQGTVEATSKFEDLGADSLDQVEIVMALEEEFKISVDEEGAESIATVQDAADLIEKTIAAKCS